MDSVQKLLCYRGVSQVRLGGGGYKSPRSFWWIPSAFQNAMRILFFSLFFGFFPLFSLFQSYLAYRKHRKWTEKYWPNFTLILHIHDSNLTKFTAAQNNHCSDSSSLCQTAEHLACALQKEICTGDFVGAKAFICIKIFGEWDGHTVHTITWELV